MFSEYICLLRTFSGHFLRFVREMTNIYLVKALYECTRNAYVQAIVRVSSVLSNSPKVTESLIALIVPFFFIFFCPEIVAREECIESDTTETVLLLSSRVKCKVRNTTCEKQNTSRSMKGFHDFARRPIRTR